LQIIGDNNKYQVHLLIILFLITIKYLQSLFLLFRYPISSTFKLELVKLLFHIILNIKYKIIQYKVNVVIKIINNY